MTARMTTAHLNAFTSAVDRNKYSDNNYQSGVKNRYSGDCEHFSGSSSQVIDTRANYGQNRGNFPWQCSGNLVEYPLDSEVLANSGSRRLSMPGDPTKLNKPYSYGFSQSYQMKPYASDYINMNNNNSNTEEVRNRKNSSIYDDPAIVGLVPSKPFRRSSPFPNRSSNFQRNRSSYARGSAPNQYRRQVRWERTYSNSNNKSPTQFVGKNTYSGSSYNDEFEQKRHNDFRPYRQRQNSFSPPPHMAHTFDRRNYVREYQHSVGARYGGGDRRHTYVTRSWHRRPMFNVGDVHFQGRYRRFPLRNRYYRRPPLRYGYSGIASNRNAYSRAINSPSELQYLMVYDDMNGIQYIPIMGRLKSILRDAVNWYYSFEPVSRFAHRAVRTGGRRFSHQRIITGRRNSDASGNLSDTQLKRLPNRKSSGSHSNLSDACPDTSNSSVGKRDGTRRRGKQVNAMSKSGNTNHLVKDVPSSKAEHLSTNQKTSKSPHKRNASQSTKSNAEGHGTNAMSGSNIAESHIESVSTIAPSQVDNIAKVSAGSVKTKDRA